MRTPSPGCSSRLKDMNPVLRQHLRYPQDLLMVQADMYGRYHITVAVGLLQPVRRLEPLADLELGHRIALEPARPRRRTARSLRFTPVYELLQLPGQSSLTFDAVEPLVPFSSNDNLQTLRALFVADSNANGYGKLDAYVTPGESIHGPGARQRRHQRQPDDLQGDHAP